jgi:predicted MFS family arabinose efflux permease
VTGLEASVAIILGCLLGFITLDLGGIRALMAIITAVAVWTALAFVISARRSEKRHRVSRKP